MVKGTAGEPGIRGSLRDPHPPASLPAAHHPLSSPPPVMSNDLTWLSLPGNIGAGAPCRPVPAPPAPRGPAPTCGGPSLYSRTHSLTHPPTRSGHTYSSGNRDTTRVSTNEGLDRASWPSPTSAEGQRHSAHTGVGALWGGHSGGGEGDGVPCASEAGSCRALPAGAWLSGG